LPALHLQQLRKSFGSVLALESLSLELPSKAHLVLTGPSGSGKSTALRIIAGLESPDAGRILRDNTDITSLAAHQRRCGWMPQSPSLLPHLDVARQLDLSLNVPGLSPSERRTRVMTLADRVGLRDRLGHLPSQLSGGEATRVALARALLNQPEFVLLDEPFAHLDTPRRRQLRRLLRELQVEQRFTLIQVTHHPFDALPDATHLACLHAGTLVQVGTVEQVWNRPVSPWIAGFLAPFPIWWLTLPTDITHPAFHGIQTPTGATLLGLRTEMLGLHSSPPAPPFIGPLRVMRIGFHGSQHLIEVQAPDGTAIEVPLSASVPPPAPGAPVWLRPEPRGILWFAGAKPER